MASNHRSNNNNTTNDNDDHDHNRQQRPVNPSVGNRQDGMQMGLSELMQFMIMHESNEAEPPEPDFPKPVKCPLCTQEHHYRPALGGGSRSRIDLRQPLFSHDARVMYTMGPCPVCSAHKAGPPLVGLACGHLICVKCFESIGGCTGANALFSTAEQAIRQRQAYQEEREREREHQRQQWQESQQQQQQSCTESNETPPGMDLLQQSNTGVNIGPGMLSMLQEIYNRRNSDDDDQDDNDMPALIPGYQVAQPGPPVLPDENSISSGEEDEDVRKLISRASGRLTVANNIPASSTAGRNNAPSARRPQSAGPFSRGIRSSANDTSDDEDVPSIPALIPRSLAGQAATRHAPPTVQRHADDDDDSNDSSTGSSQSPELIPPSQIQREDDSDEDVLPVLHMLDTNNSDEDDYDDDDSDEPPPLVPMTTHAPVITQVPSAVPNVPQQQSRRTVASTQVSAAVSPARAAASAHVYGPPPRPPATATVPRHHVSSAAAAAPPDSRTPDSTKKAAEKKLAERKCMRERYYNELMTKAREMKTSKLKRELRSLKVSTINFVEKMELYQAYAEAMAERKYPVDDEIKDL